MKVLSPEPRAALVARGGVVTARSFYGPGTWVSREGDVGDQVRRREAPVIGKGDGIWNLVHIDDAAAATCAALTADPGVYNIVDDQPVARSVWLPAFSRFVGAPEPPTVSEEEALRNYGPDRVCYATKLRGASNQKQKASWVSVRDRSNGSGCEQAQRSDEQEHSFLSERRIRAVTQQASTDPNLLEDSSVAGAAFHPREKIADSQTGQVSGAVASKSRLGCQSWLHCRPCTSG